MKKLELNFEDDAYELLESCKKEKGFQSWEDFVMLLTHLMKDERCCSHNNGFFKPKHWKNSGRRYRNNNRKNQKKRRYRGNDGLDFFDYYMRSRRRYY